MGRLQPVPQTVTQPCQQGKQKTREPEAAVRASPASPSPRRYDATTDCAEACRGQASNEEKECPFLGASGLPGAATEPREDYKTQEASRHPGGAQFRPSEEVHRAQRTLEFPGAFRAWKEGGWGGKIRVRARNYISQRAAGSGRNPWHPRGTGESPPPPPPPPPPLPPPPAALVS